MDASIIKFRFSIIKLNIPASHILLGNLILLVILSLITGIKNW
jgi:hypothetical protein